MFIVAGGQMGLQGSALNAPLLVYARRKEGDFNTSLVGDISSHLRCDTVHVDHSTSFKSTFSKGVMLVFQGWDGSIEMGQILRAYRKLGPSIPILVVGVNNAPSLRASAFDCGADNYLGQTFTKRELIAKVHRLSQLANQWGVRRPPISASNLQIWPEAHIVLHEGKDVRLSRREFETLVVLAKQHPNPVKRETLEREVLGHHHDPGTNAIAVHVHRLRKKLENHGAVLETVPGHGYRLK